MTAHSENAKTDIVRPAAEKAGGLSACYRSTFDIGAKTVTLHFKEIDEAEAFHRAVFEQDRRPAAGAGGLCATCHGEGVDGEPGDEPGTGQTWKCKACNGKGWVRDLHDMEQGLIRCEKCLRPTAVVAADLHPDDAAVDRFAGAMKAKMAAARAKGRGGWDDPAQCTIEKLAAMLCQHVEKGDPVDIANFAMMIHQRKGSAIDVYEALAVFINSRTMGNRPPAMGAGVLSSQQVADRIRESRIMSPVKFGLYLNGDPVELYPQELVALAQLFDRPTASGAGDLPARHPVQPLVTDEHGHVRFKRNSIVDALADGKLNDIAALDYPQEDREQLAQLIGYSLDGFGTLSYVTDETYQRAAAQRPTANGAGDRNG